MFPFRKQTFLFHLITECLLNIFAEVQKPFKDVTGFFYCASFFYNNLVCLCANIERQQPKQSRRYSMQSVLSSLSIRYKDQKLSYNIFGGVKLGVFTKKRVGTTKQKTTDSLAEKLSPQITISHTRSRTNKFKTNQFLN